MYNNRNQARYVSVMAAAVALTVACGAGNGGNDVAQTDSSQPSLTAAASSSGGLGNDAYPSRPDQPTASSAATAVDKLTVTTRTGLGQILVDGSGRTLYLFLKDTTAHSRCADQCAQVWPPALGGAHTAVGKGASPSLLGTTSRQEGTSQLTYNSHPLYFYIGDGSSPGKAAGEGLNQFGAEWYAVSPAGNKSEKDGS